MPTLQKTRRMLDYIREYQQEHCVVPSMEHLGEKFNLRSTASVKRHFDIMQEQGWIKRGRYARYVEFLEPREAARLSQNELKH